MQAEAKKVRDEALPPTEAGLKKLTLPPLKAALEERGLEVTNGAEGAADRAAAGGL